MREFNRPYMILTTALMTIAASAMFFHLTLFSPSADEVEEWTLPTSTPYTAPACEEAMRNPTDRQCQLYAERLKEQGYTQANDGRWIR